MVTKICTVQSFARDFDEPDRVYSVSFRDRHVDNVRRLFFSSFSCQSFPLEPLPRNAIRYLRYTDLLIATTRGRSVFFPPQYTSYDVRYNITISYTAESYNIMRTYGQQRRRSLRSKWFRKNLDILFGEGFVLIHTQKHRKIRFL